jgi:hypothetical protein
VVATTRNASADHGPAGRHARALRINIRAGGTFASELAGQRRRSGGAVDSLCGPDSSPRPRSTHLHCDGDDDERNDRLPACIHISLRARHRRQHDDARDAVTRRGRRANVAPARRGYPVSNHHPISTAAATAATAARWY